MTKNRRRFLTFLSAGVTTSLAGTWWWMAASKRRAARYARVMLADVRRSIAPAPVMPDPASWSNNRITLCWLGHATVLMNFYGLNILTDPAFCGRVGISLGFMTGGPKRHVAPALRIHELPPIDAIILSHAHMDHMDLPSLRRLSASTPVVTASQTADILTDARLKNVHELRWGERQTLRTVKGDLELEAFEVKHWGQRWPSELERGYNGYILRREGKALLFGGDTALTPSFSRLRSRGPFEAAIMPIGAYRPWIWNHCSPEEAVEMANAAGARVIVPVHHQTFKLSDEPLLEPIQRFEAALDREQDRIGVRRVGESVVCSV